MFKKLWNKIRKFFKDSETIALAWFHAVGGAALGALNYFDWNKLLTMVQGAGLSKTQLYVGAAILGVQGLVIYVARTFRAKDL